MGLSSLLSRTYESFDGRIAALGRPILIVLIVGLVLRILFLGLTNVDSWGWYGTGENIVSGNGFYDRLGYYYGPAFGYLVSFSLVPGAILTGIGVFSTQVDPMIALQGTFSFEPALQTVGFLALFKIMMVVGDVIAAFLVRWLVIDRTGDPKTANAAFAMIFLAPIVLIESSIHGMFDIYCGFLALLSIYFASKGRYLFCGVAWMAATLMKIFPLFLLPVLLAFIFRDCRGDKKAIFCSLAMAAIGCAISFGILYYPQILDGTFADTWSFLIGRIDSAGGVMGMVKSHIMLLIPAGIAFLLIYTFIVNRFIDKGFPLPKLSALQAVSVMAGLVVVVLAGLIYVNGGADEMFANLFHSSYLLGLVVQGIALLFSIYVALRLYRSGEEDPFKLLLTAGLISIAAAFLWVPMPEYLIIILPMVCVYAFIYDRRYLTPFLFIAIGAAFFIIMVEGPAALFVSVAAYTDLMSIDTVVSLTEAYAGGFHIGDISVPQLVFCAIGAGLQLIGVIILFVYRVKPFRKEADFV